MSEKPIRIRHKQFEFGPVATGIYSGLLWTTLVVPLYSIDFFFWYVAVLLFLGLGLRPLLELTGLYRWLVHARVLAGNRISRKFDEEHAQKIDRKMRDDRYRNRRQKHSDLTKNRK